MSNTRITVPLALDAELRMPVAMGADLPIRSIIALGIAVVPAMVAFLVLSPLGTLRYVVPILLLFMALVISLPKMDNIWIGTQLVYRLVDRWLPSGVINGRSVRIIRQWRGDMFEVESTKPVSRRVHQLPMISDVATLPHLEDVGDGYFGVKPGGYRGVLSIEGPNGGFGSESTQDWSRRFMEWVATLECPVQIFANIETFDREDALEAFDERVGPTVMATPLIKQERDLVGDLASRSFHLKSYLVLNPEAASPGSGKPYESSLMDRHLGRNTSLIEVMEKLNAAQRIASSFYVRAKATPAAEIHSLLERSILGADSVTATERAVQIKQDGRPSFHIPFAITRLPRMVSPGEVVDAVMQSQTAAQVSLYVAPVSRNHARRRVEGMVKLRSSVAADKGPIAPGDSMMAVEGEQILEMLAEGMRSWQVGLSCAISAPSITAAEEAAERFLGIMNAKRFALVHARQPGLYPFMACTPGGVPLGRSLLMTTTPVVERLIPAIGTCLDDRHDALIGVNSYTDAPAYWDCWNRGSNHNLLMVGTSGGGKSVTLKTMLYRHWLAGTNFVVLDPDSEYRNLLAAVDGEYYELGEDGQALNALAIARFYPPDEAASLVLPLMSVMGGETKFDAKGHPIRRMLEEDQSWMFDQLVGFFRSIAPRFGQASEATLGDFINYLEVRVTREARNESEAIRARRICDRIGFYTKGRLGEIFNRQSTFELGKVPVGIGFKSMANSYGNNLTPALAVVLTAILAVMDQAQQRFLVVVDEASYLTSNPDAGQVLDQVVRRGRKAGTGTWMATQKLDDFLSTDLGTTLAATSSTRWVLGCQENMLPQVAEVFALTPEEMAALNPIVKGRGVVVCDNGERSVVSVVASDIMLAVASTSPAIAERRYGE